MVWEVVSTEKTMKRMTQKKALCIVLAAALILLVLLSLRVFLSKTDNSTQAGRILFLESLGWEVDAESEEHKSVRLPQELGEVLEGYNQMQKAQGYDLSRHLGERCEQYSYLVTNYPDSAQTVWVTLYIQGRRVIAGDVHSTALDGFMHGLKIE